MHCWYMLAVISELGQADRNVKGDSPIQVTAKAGSNM